MNPIQQKNENHGLLAISTALAARKPAKYSGISPWGSRTRSGRSTTNQPTHTAARAVTASVRAMSPAVGA